MGTFKVGKERGRKKRAVLLCNRRSRLMRGAFGDRRKTDGRGRSQYRNERKCGKKE
jgi:hypothetical protein